MESKQFGTRILVRLDPGDEVVASVMRACEEYGVKLGMVSGIGAVGRAVIGLFRTDTKVYIKSELKGAFEIVSLLGNVSTMDGKTYLHLHANLADEKHQCFGGHLNEADVSATAEIWIDAVEGGIDRYFDEKIGLNLIKF
ncbi:PPC domain-containing DNA-binding protein [Paucidesulfovibrio longus]|uniref:PPC domain-containing DNA-binding protein n=1 Tax=Paucidesulfovibrio longus TaxID=889 RepID=UPI0003B3E12B|nr:PPC domain-containing DNA-binding protein [Paucidesulfovibrio longus]